MHLCAFKLLLNRHIPQHARVGLVNLHPISQYAPVTFEPKSRSGIIDRSKECRKTRSKLIGFEVMFEDYDDDRAGSDDVRLVSLCWITNLLMMSIVILAC